MMSLVKCLVYPETNLGKMEDKLVYLSAKDFFPNPILNDEFRINAPPDEVLSQTLHTHYLQGYLGVQPWIVDISKKRGYLDISEIEGKRADGTIADLLIKKDFLIAQRPSRLNPQQIRDLVGQIMENLKPDNILGLFVSREEVLSSKVYTDILRVLGEEISQEQIEKMFLTQYQALDNYKNL